MTLSIEASNWIDRDRFDIVAKANDVETQKMEKMTRTQWVVERTLMLQMLLTDRFGLKVSVGEKTIPVYALVIIKSGAKFASAAANDGKYSLSVHDTHMVVTISMDVLANYLTRMPEAEDREVVNRTGLIGNYDFKLDWTRDRDNGGASDGAYPGLFSALREELGLELKSTTAPFEVICVKSANKPEFD